MSTKDLGALSGNVLVFGGPYSNLAATQALLEKAHQLNIPQHNIICSGDIVAYCAEPEQTTQLIRHTDIHVLMGNCEQSVASDNLDCGCGFEEGMTCSTLSTQWYEFVKQKISPESKKWMAALPRFTRFQLGKVNFGIVHGSYSSINQFIFQSTDTEIKQNEIKQANVDVIIGGHCGIPFGQKLVDGYWLNAGVIGLPANDGTTDGWYLLLKPAQNQVEASWHRLQYDCEKSYQSMQTNGLTNYAQTIINGLWPSMDILPEKEQNQQGNKLSLAPIQIPS